MVSVTSASRNITSASSFHSRYQRRSSMYTRGLMLWNFAELADAVPIGKTFCDVSVNTCQICIGFEADKPENSKKRAHLIGLSDKDLT